MEIQETTATVWKHDPESPLMDEEASKKWEWLKTVKEQVRRWGYDFDCGDHVEKLMTYVGMADVRAVGRYEMPFGTWGEPHTREMGLHMVEWQKGIHKRVMERFLKGKVRMNWKARDRLRTELDEFLGPEEGKYKALSVITAWKSEKKGG